MTDADLVRRIQAGDVSAWIAIYDRYLHVVWRYVYRGVGGNAHDTDDIVSETMLGIVRGIGTVDPQRGELAPWIFTIAKRKLTDHFRKVSREKQNKPLDAETVADPRSTFTSCDNRMIIAEVTQRLRDDERVALEWKYLERLSVSEIAGRLGRTEKSVESMLHRARQSFRSMFKELSDTHDP